MEKITNKLEKTIDKPIYAIRILAVFMLLDFFTVKIHDNTFINLIFIEKDYVKMASTISYVLLSIFIFKCVIGAIVSKLYLRYGNNFVKIPDYGSFSVEYLLNKAEKRNNSQSTTSKAGGTLSYLPFSKKDSYCIIFNLKDSEEKSK